MNGFGLPTLKAEGAPRHPDDIDADLTEEQYEAQLKLYNEYYQIKEKE